MTSPHPVQSPSSPPPDWRAAVAKVVLGMAGPLVGLGFHPEWLKDHPWRTASLLVLYELLVFCGQIVAGIWQRLKGPWLDAAARWVDDSLQQAVSRYRRKYLEHLFYECRDFDVKGLSTQGTFTLELDRVFVELRVDATPPHKASVDPIAKLPEHLLHGKHDIWEYLAANRNLAIIGPPGSGKTTLLKHIVLVLAGRHKHSRGKRAPKRLPVLLFLRSHAKAIGENPDYPLADAIREGDVIKEQGIKPPPGWFELSSEMAAV